MKLLAEDERCMAEAKLSTGNQEETKESRASIGAECQDRCRHGKGGEEVGDVRSKTPVTLHGGVDPERLSPTFSSSRTKAHVNGMDEAQMGKSAPEGYYRCHVPSSTTAQISRTHLRQIDENTPPKQRDQKQTSMSNSIKGQQDQSSVISDTSFRTEKISAANVQYAHQSDTECHKESADKSNAAVASTTMSERICNLMVRFLCVLGGM